MTETETETKQAEYIRELEAALRVFADPASWANDYWWIWERKTDPTTLAADALEKRPA